ncbi:MAG: T9SS type A sorting domain-containing protein [Bacteroidota bacterium]|nr:T9SS type A sorting domain-containing protein [Bacteroidota bacterium]
MKIPRILFHLIVINIFIFHSGQLRAQIISTYAGAGNGDGTPAVSVSLFTPGNVCADAIGNMFITKLNGYSVRRIDALTGIITTVAGNNLYGYAGDSVLANSTSLDQVSAIELDGSGNLYIIGGKRIRKVDANTGIITTVAGNGTTTVPVGGYPCNAKLAALPNPVSIAFDGSGNMFIADGAVNTIYKVNASGILSSFASFNYPNDITCDPSGNLFIVEINRIRKIPSIGGTVSTIAGSGTPGFSGDGGPATSANLSNPRAISIDANWNLYIADQNNNRIRKVELTTGIIRTVAGTGVDGYNGDGDSATKKRLNYPSDVFSDASGNLYISDYVSARIRKVNAITTFISTVAGNGLVSFAGDGYPANSASFNNSAGAAVDKFGNVYFADTDNNRVRKINASSGIITTIAGNGYAGFLGDGYPATSANLNAPLAVAVDTSGNLYIADKSNNRIRKVNYLTGVITTVAGNGSPAYSGDNGQATLAAIKSPCGIAVSPSGNLFIADRGNSKIRKVIASTGIITTMAGNGTGGNGGQAYVAAVSPNSLALDVSGNLYFSDYATVNTIRKITISSGIISKVAGNSNGYSGDGGLATLAGLNNPSGITLDTAGNLFIADLYNYRIRRINALTGIITTIAGNALSYPTGDGSIATTVGLGLPNAVAIDATGNLYITLNDRIRKVTGVLPPLITSQPVNTIVCSGKNAIFTLSALYSYNYQWKIKQGGLFVNVVNNNKYNGATTNTLVINSVDSTFNNDTFQCLLTGLCGSVNSTMAILKVTSVITGNSIAGVQTICSGATPTLLSGSVPGGGNGNYTFKWIKSQANANINFINAGLSDTSLNYNVAALVTNTWYKRMVTSGGCMDSSNPVAISVIPTIVNNIESQGQMICIGSNVSNIIGSIPTGGYGSYSYKWLLSTTNSANNFSNAGFNDSAINYSPNSPAVTTWYKRIVISGACRDTGLATWIIVNPAISNNIISGTQTICLGTAPSIFSGSTVIGGVGSFTFRWLKSSDNGNTFTNAGLNDSANNYSSGPLIVNALFKRFVSSGGCTDISNTVQITTHSVITNNLIYGAQSVCGGNSPSVLSGTIPSGGIGSFSFRWLKKVSGMSAGYIYAGEDDSTFDYYPSSLFSTTQFKRLVMSGVCKDSGYAIQVNVNPQIANNNLVGAQNICAGASALPINGSMPFGGNGSFTFGWIKSITDSFNNFSNAGLNDTSVNYSPTNITVNSWYRRIISSGGCMDTSMAIPILTIPVISGNSIQGSQNICTGAIPAVISGSVTNGGNGSYLYKWLKCLVNDTNNLIFAGDNDSTLSYNPTPINNTTWYRRLVKSGACSDTSNTAQVIVSQHISNNVINGTQNICFGATPTAITGTLPIGGSGNFECKWLVNQTGAGGVFSIAGANDSNLVSYLPAISQTSWYKRLINSGGCIDTSNPVQISVYPLPVTSSINGESTPDINSMKTYSVINAVGSSYHWYFNNGSGISTINSINITWNTIGTDQIKLVETSSNNCNGDTIRLHVKIITPVGIGSVSGDLYNIYPNPGNGKYIIESTSSELKKLELYNGNGDLILILNLYGTTSIDISTLSEGIYFLRIKSGSQFLNKKLILIK